MRRIFLKRLPLLLIVLSSACAAPLHQTSTTFDREVARVAILMADEIHNSRPPWHAGRWPSVQDDLNLFDLSRHIVTLSHSYELDPLLVLAIMKVESQFRPRVRSFAGAVGLMQVMPIVLREVGKDIDVDQREDLLDPYKNVHIGIHYFTFLLDKYRHDVEKALIAYNMGPAALDGYLARASTPSPRYYNKVMQYYRAFQEKILDISEVT